MCPILGYGVSVDEMGEAVLLCLAGCTPNTRCKHCPQYPLTLKAPNLTGHESLLKKDHFHVSRKLMHEKFECLGLHDEQQEIQYKGAYTPQRTGC